MSAPTHEQVKKYAAQIAKKSGIANPNEKALHVYLDTDGTPLYWRVRVKNTTTGDKWIRPFYWNGEAFVMGEPPAPPEGKPLYGLERLARYPEAVVIIPEGENGVDALNKALASSEAADVMALTSGGASSAQAANWAHLAGRHVVIFPDNDDAGAKYAADVVECLRCIAASVSVLDIAPLNLPPKGDAVDWLQTGGTIDALKLAITDTVGSDSSPSIASGDAMPLPESTAQADTPAQQADEVVKALANLSKLEYEKVRLEKAKALGFRPTVLDDLVKTERAKGSGIEGESKRLPFNEVEPHADPIDPARVLSEVFDTIRQFIILDTEQAIAAALWVALTHFIDVVEVAPLAIINAPEKSCGKTQFLTVLGRMAYRPLPASNASASALFRAVELWKPTILIDEADTFFRDNFELHGMVNAGYLRDGYVLRSEAVGDSFEPRMFSVFSAKALAGIALEKHLPDATMSRGIVFNLRRKLPHESASRLRHADRGLFVGIAEKLARFAADYSQQVRQARPILPDVLSDREQDNWDTLLAIASCAGAEWLARATAAALKLSGAGESKLSIGNELLADIQHIFESKRADRIGTADLIAALCEDQEAPWGTYNRGKPITPRQVSKQLSAYSVTSKTIRIGAYETVKGFEFSQFSDAFTRYLSIPSNLPSQGNNTLEANKHGALDVTDKPTQKIPRHNSETPEAAPVLGCNAVTDKASIFEGVL